MINRTEIKEVILSEIESTQVLVRKYRALTAPIAPENAIGHISRMDAINNKSVNEAALRNAERKHSNLEVALSKIHDLDFGICIRCRKSIPTGRILLMPQTVVCVNCAK